MVQNKSFNKSERSSFVQKASGSLALRVLTVCSILVIIPLLLNTLYIYVQDYRAKMGDLFLTLYVMGKDKSLLLKEIIQSSVSDMNILEVTTNLEQQPVGTLGQKLNEIASDNQYSLIFYLSSAPNGDLICTQSSYGQMVGQKNIFLDEAQQTIKDGQHQFPAVNPITNLQDFFSGKTVVSSGVLQGVMFMGIPMKKVIDSLAPLNQPAYSYRLSLVSTQGSIFSTTNVDVPLSKSRIFKFSPEREKTIQELEQFKKKIGLREIFFHKYQRIGLEIPISGTDFSLVIDVNERAIFEVSKDNALLGLFSLLLLILVLGGAGTMLLTRRIAKPLRALSGEMEKIGSGDLTAHYTPDKMGFEINVLGQNFNAMIDSLIKHIEEAKNERVRSETLAQELKIGHEIQKMIFPKEMPEFPGLDIASGFLSAKEVAGDFYDLFVKKDEKGTKLMMAVADASGKGISACLYALGVRSMLRSFEASFDDISKTIRSTNHLFSLDTGDTGVFVTAWIGVYDPATSLLNYSCCGHPPGILRRKNRTIEELTTPGTALGAIPNPEITSASVRLESGDVLVLYTDGIPEAHDLQMNQFGKSRLIDIVHAGSGQSAQELVDRIFKEIGAFSEGAPQHDDLTLLVIRVL
ncbi:MAG TPA: SpoIIE family protein phosphatase [Rhabdochlamydiaceae bacterium]|nr:SpoIIE family protein phosphatase [Rhabdochlamydiaceae bacterium]